jgi:carbonic anhydrase/acetyltransferase-like protein (isoleucine patch superfamily)
MTVYAFGDKQPKLGARVYIAPTAAVIGDVELGDDASVWFSSVIRADMYPVRIGARVNVQDGAVVHVTGGIADVVIGDDVTIGHLALVHGCHVGSRVLIGMGSVILDNARIGDECIIAAGSLVPPRMQIPARSFVKGSPAKIVREVTPQDLLMVEGGSSAYQMYAAQYLAPGGLRVLPEPEPHA